MAVAYINHQGGTRSQAVMEESAKILKWAETYVPTPSAVYVLGVESWTAHSLSRTTVDPGEWSLHPEVFGSNGDSQSEVDLIASRLLHKLPAFISRTRDPWHQIKYSRLPHGYCRYFFNTFKGCVHTQCSYLHIPKNCDEKVCMDVLHKLLSENSTFLLKRAEPKIQDLTTNIFTFRSLPKLSFRQIMVILGLMTSTISAVKWARFHSRILQNFLLSTWDKSHLFLDKKLSFPLQPTCDQIIKVFESVAFSGLQTAYSRLLDIFCKFVHNGMNITPVQINHIIAIMSKSSAANNHISILLSMKSSLELKTSKTNWTCDMDAVLSEVEHCKVNSDWMKLGTLYLTVCTGCENLTNIKKFSRCIAEALMKDSINERPEIPYCEFASAIFKNSQFNEIQKNILGRIGISVMFFYHDKEMWLKGRKVINKFHELKINYTILKGLLGQESTMSRCHVVNIAVEIFLKCGNLGSAMHTLKESDWIINTSMWPCNMMDVLHRHNLMCLLVCEALSKSMFTLCFEVLQNLPGFQESQNDVNVSQYAMLFNKVLNTCVANRSIGISASIVDFMIVKKIPIDYLNLQVLITTLGRSSLWNKTRDYYKSAMTLGFYPLFERKTNPNILYIPSFMSEVEMLMTIEQFMVLNASSIRLQGGCNQSPQIVLKRMEQDNAKSKDSYHASAERLFEASRLSNPRLFIKHMTVNNKNEEVYTLDSNSALKWLNENMKWAGSVWYFH
ncbi:protein TOPAZ1 [Bufo gargarizans]|uniref:protein TOPAZ1 n=1 Tax=Bufo gargarizans TaxID=30331 RepID=UPI001CF5EFEC|nr:protein TOPAZ1 [Bufo gargarizans]